MPVVVSAQGEAPGVRPAHAPPSSQMPAVLQKVAFEQRLNEPLPLDLPFRDENGVAVKLGDYFGRKPVVLAFVYYECPMLCTQVLNGLETALRVLDESVGQEFDVVTVSFDPRETPVLASGKEEGVSRSLPARGRGAGLAFPDRRAGVDRRAHEGSGLQLLLGRTDAAVRARQRHRGGDAGRNAVALLLRHRLLAARPQVRADRVVPREDRLVGRSVVALLLSLRSRDRQLRICGDARGAAGRRRHARGAVRIHVRIDPIRLRQGFRLR